MIRESIKYDDAYLQSRFEHFNELLGLGLPHIPCEFKRQKVGGKCVAQVYKASREIAPDSIKIYFSTYYLRDPDEIDGIIVHEMVHAYFLSKGICEGHGPRFNAMCRKLSTQLGWTVPLTDNTSERKLADTAKRKELIVIIRDIRGSQSFAIYGKMDFRVQSVITGLVQRQGGTVEFYQTTSDEWNNIALSVGIQRIPTKSGQRFGVKWWHLKDRPNLIEELKWAIRLEDVTGYQPAHLRESVLPMDDESRKRRAYELGFTIPAFHGTTGEFNEFDLDRGSATRMGFAPYFADNRHEAYGYAEERARERGGKPVLMPLLLRVRKPLVLPNMFGKVSDKGSRISEELYKAISGGYLPKDSSREFWMIAADAMRQARDVYYEEHGSFDNKVIWAGIYKRLRDLGYDAIVHEDTPSDYGNGKYKKIVMLDMSGIRSIDAEFDPALADSTNLRA